MNSKLVLFVCFIVAFTMIEETSAQWYDYGYGGYPSYGGYGDYGYGGYGGYGDYGYGGYGDYGYGYYGKRAAGFKPAVRSTAARKVAAKVRH